MAVYLDFPEAPFTPHQLCPRAHFEIVAVNQKEESMSIRRSLGYPSWQALTLLCPEAHHMFTSQATDWGFSKFLPLRDTKENGAGFVVNDTLILRVNVTVQRDMHLDRLTRSQTGFVCLKDRGEDSYVNSLLQCLYHVCRFRRVRIRLLDMPDYNENGERSRRFIACRRWRRMSQNDPFPWHCRSSSTK